MLQWVPSLIIYVGSPDGEVRDFSLGRFHVITFSTIGGDKFHCFSIQHWLQQELVDKMGNCC